MQVVTVRYAAPGGGIAHKQAQVLGNYPALDSLRVRILDTGEVRHINPRSVVPQGKARRPEAHHA